MRAWRNVLPALTLVLAIAAASPTAAQLVARPVARQSQTTPAQTQQPTSGTAVVPANGGWIRSGFAAKQGERLQVNAQGTWSTGASLAAAIPSAGPDGFANLRNPAALLPSAPVGALIARVGDTGRPFVVGASYAGVSPTDGPLYLAFNDDPSALKDNTGRIAASIAITPAPAGQTQPQTTRPPRPTISQAIADALKQLQQPATPPASQAPTAGAGADKPPGAQPPPASRGPTQPPPTDAPPSGAKPPSDAAPSEPASPPSTDQPATTPAPPAAEAPVTPVDQTGPPPEVAPQETPPPADPAAPFNPLLLIGAAVVALGVLLLATRALGRGQRNTEPEHPAGAPRISAQLGADGRSSQVLTVKWRRRT